MWLETNLCFQYQYTIMQKGDKKKKNIPAMRISFDLLIDKVRNVWQTCSRENYCWDRGSEKVKKYVLNKNVNTTFSKRLISTSIIDRRLF